MSALRDPFPIVYSRNLPQAVAFYCGALGFEQGYRWPPDGDPDFLVVRLGTFSLGLASASAPEELLGRPMGSGLRYELCLYADDVDEAVRELCAAGAPLLRPPADMPWGERIAYVADPDGNPIHLAARPAEA